MRITYRSNNNGEDDNDNTDGDDDNNAATDKTVPKDKFLSLKELSKLDDVFVIKPDKGNVIVLLNKLDYN